MRVLKRIPKASRVQAAKLLTQLLNKVTAENSKPAWERLMHFASRCFLHPNRGGIKSRSLATVINCQIRDFAEDKPAAQQTAPKPKAEKKEPTNVLSKLVSSKIACGDTKGAVRIISSDATILGQTPEILDEMRRKHHDPHPGSQLPPPTVTYQTASS